MFEQYSDLEFVNYLEEQADGFMRSGGPMEEVAEAYYEAANRIQDLTDE